MDRISKEHRSWNMSRIRSQDTKPEQIVRSLLHRLGFRFRKSTGRHLAGSPDIVLPKYKTVIFVHGCFWHRHARCRQTTMPKSRVDFWKAKFESNRLRDRKVKRLLEQQGWRILVIWQCELKDQESLILRMTSAIVSPSLE